MPRTGDEETDLAAPNARTRTGSRRYSRLRRIDGRHPFQRAAPGAYVAYRARRRHDTRVAYVNFELAREMGLLAASHPDRLTAGLRDALLDTFGLVILNEYDYLHRTKVAEEDLLPHAYMATRYLQLQHPDKRGLSSGDGRSIWNGCVRHRGVTWDVSSCGTGVTRLSPATSQHKRFFETGNWISSYGCGTAAIEEGINAALMAEIFHRNGIATERVLAVLALPNGLAINVRAAPCLLRPSHFFVHLARGDLAALRETVDFYIDRRIANGDWPDLPKPDCESHRATRYAHFARQAALTFGRVTARFESDYVFCWLDWDGDNILADGGIIDYGSVRQFGLCHREYRFDDSDRFSTTLLEQRSKARQIVQKHAQIRDYLIRGERPTLAEFDDDPILQLFDDEFSRTRTARLLERIGFDAEESAMLTRDEISSVRRLQRVFSSFERARSSRGLVKVPDGITWNAVYCLSDVLRELPIRYSTRLDGVASPASRDAWLLAPREFLDLALSDYASDRDAELTDHRARMAREFQRAYVDLIDAVARRSGATRREILGRLARRTPILNPHDRITGDAVDHAASQLLGRRPRLSPESIHRLIQAFVDDQDQDPKRFEARAKAGATRLSAAEKRVLLRMRRIAREFREGL